MAFDTLGVNVVASGIRGVAGDIGHLALSFLRYVRAVQQADKASVKTAASQSKLADTMAGKAQTNIDRLERKWYKLTATANSLNTTIKILQMTMRDPIAAESNYTKALQDFQRQKIVVEQVKLAYQGFINAKQMATASAFLPFVTQEEGALKKLAAALDKAQKEYIQSLREQNKYKTATQAVINVNEDLIDVNNQIPVAQKAVADSTKMAAESQQNWADAILAASNQAGPFARILSDLTGAFGAAFAGNSAFLSGLGLTVPQLGAVMVAMDALKLGVRLAQAAFNAFVAVVRVVWNVLKKLVSIVWDVAKAIGKTLWNAVKKIATAPFNLVSKLFGNMGGSMQRVMEMAIGMNLSRVWWQLGMKIRDMAKMASDAAVGYQVTFNRLRTLIFNEISAEYGQDMTVSEYEEAAKRATVATEELVKWTSKLAVSTIYDAEDILNVYTLAMSYGFASTQAEKLTEAVLDFASGMGLGDTEMKRVIENFGQMRAQGKITGTELRDLARGAFVPVNEVLEEMAKNAGLIGDYDVPNMQSISAVLAGMAENGELTADAFAAINTQLGKLGADGKITRQEFEGLVQDLSQNDVMAKFGLSAEQAGLALEGIKTGALTADLNELIKTGKLTVDEFFEAFIEIVTNKYPNAARSMGLTMKAVKSNISDFISTMIGWRVIAPVFEVVAKHTQDFIQNVLMSDKQIASFDRMGKAFKVVTELLMTYSTAMRKANDIAGKLFGTGPLAAVRKFATSLLDVVGALGTEDFAGYFVGFERALTLLFLPSKSNSLVLSGIKSLDGIMKDIMEGVEIDPAALKKSLDDVFGTLWREFFGPKIKEGIELAWSKHVAPAIGKLWQRMKDKFSEWKADKLMPWIKTFFVETLPGWISGFGKWITENGPGIVTSVGKFIADIFDALRTSSAETLGEDHPLTKLAGLMERIALYTTTKIADPTADINAANLTAVAEAFDSLVLSLEKLVSKKLLDIPEVSSFIEKFNGPNVQANVLAMVDFMDTLSNIVTMNLAPANALFGGIADLFSGGNENAGGVEKMTKMVEFFDRVYAFVGLVSSIPSASLTSMQTLFDGIAEFIKTLRDWDSDTQYDPEKGILATFKEFMLLFETNWFGGAQAEALTELADKIAGFIDTILGLDTNGLRERLRNITDAVREFLGLAPIDWPSLSADLDLKINLNPSTNDPNYDFDENGNLVYVGTGAGQPPSTPIQMTIPVVIAPQATLPDGTSADMSNWLDNWLAGNWVGAPLAEGAETMDVGVNIIPSIDATKAGTDMAVDFSSGFSTSIATAMSGVNIPIPEISVERRRKVSDDAAAMVAEIAAVFTSDTTVASAGSTMMDGLLTSISSKTSDAQQTAEGIASSLSSPLNILSGAFTSAGANAVQGLWNGMASVMRSLIAWWIQQVAYLNSIVPTMNNSHSPSRLYRGYGEDMMKGLQLGLESGQSGAVSQMHDAAIELRQALGAIGTGTISPQQYNNVSNTTNWNVNVTTPLVASTPIQAYEILRMRAR